MASLQIVKSSLSPFSASRHSDFGRKSCSRRVLEFQSHWTSRILFYRGFRIHSKLQEDDNQSKGEEPPESLFMKELKRRGMTRTSILEESSRSIYGDEEMKVKELEGGYSKRNAVSTDEKRLSNQREVSMALNSEGLEGLIPRAKLLLSIGATFFLGYGPLILITVAFFSALYLYFGPTFVHDGSVTPISPPQYIDPYALLEDESISQMAPRVN